jgi:hypothetical protein
MALTISWQQKKARVIPTGVARLFLARRSWACRATEWRDLSSMATLYTTALTARAGCPTVCRAFCARQTVDSFFSPNADIAHA